MLSEMSEKEKNNVPDAIANAGPLISVFKGSNAQVQASELSDPFCRL